MQSLLAFTVACALSLLVSQPGCSAPQNEEKGKTWFMFFMKGDGKTPEGKDPNEMLKGHLANMTSHFEAGKLKAAGPLKDPTEQRRGITVLLAKDRKEVDSYFVNDPFVQAGMMKVEAWKWDVDASRFNAKIDPNALSEYRLVLVKRGKGMQPETMEMQKQHAAAMDAFNRPDAPAVWGDVEAMDHVRQVMIVTTKDDAGIRAGFKSDPLVSKAILELEIIPLYMSKGLVR